MFAVSLVQYSPCWEDAQINLSRLGAMLRPLAGKTNLIVLPEMFSTGFSMNTVKICNSSAETLQWMRQQAQSTGAMIAGSMAVAENARCYNRFYCVSPDGNVEYYNKRHLFTMSAEPQHFTAGVEQVQFTWLGWEIKPVICYDLRFPAWCRNNRTKPYDLLICPASWPSVRNDAWLTLLKARALENQCYVAGVNRTGTDGNGLHHSGNSIIYWPKGETVGQIPENEEATATFNLSLPALRDFRKKFPVLDDMDEIGLGNEAC